MIRRTFEFLAGELNGFLGVRYPQLEEHAVVWGLGGADGGASSRIDNRLVLSLANLERETLGGHGGLAARGAGYAAHQPALHLNLYLLLSASYPQDYPQALQMLGTAMGYFQGKPAYDARSSDDFPPGVSRLQLELVNLSIQELNNLWAIMGAKYLPSALYKVRMLTIQENWTTETVPAVERTDASVGG
jgi:hypothetical protein